MGKEVTYDANSRLMRVRVWGDDHIHDWPAAKVELLQLYEAKGANTLLVDVREQETSPPLFDILDFGDAWTTAIRVAIVVSRTTPKDMSRPTEGGCLNVLRTKTLDQI